MSFSLFDATAKTYSQILGSIDGVLAKGAEHFEASGSDVNDVLGVKLIDDMLPFAFQVVSVAHHSLGALQGASNGEFGPPQMGDHDYAGLHQLVKDASAGLDDFSEEAVNGLEGKVVVFKMGDMQMPFKAEDFLLTFSLPNFYFHATTTYDILRMKGVQLGKRDFLGRMRLNM